MGLYRREHWRVKDERKRQKGRERTRRRQRNPTAKGTPQLKMPGMWEREARGEGEKQETETNEEQVEGKAPGGEEIRSTEESL